MSHGKTIIKGVCSLLTILEKNGSSTEKEVSKGIIDWISLIENLAQIWEEGQSDKKGKCEWVRGPERYQIFEYYPANRL